MIRRYASVRNVCVCASVNSAPTEINNFIKEPYIVERSLALDDTELPPPFPDEFWLFESEIFCTKSIDLLNSSHSPACLIRTMDTRHSLELLLLFETELLPVDDAFVDDELFVLFDVPLVLCCSGETKN